MTKDEEHPITITGLVYEFVKSHKYMLVLYLVFLAIMPVRDVGIPHMFGKLVKAIEEKSSLITPLVYLFIATLLLQLAYSIIDVLEIELSPRFQAFIRHKIIKHVMTENNENFAEIESGELLSRFMRLPHSLYTFINQWKYIFIPNLLLSIAAIVYFSIYNIVLGIVLALLITFSWTMVYLSVKACLKHSYKAEQTVSRMYEEADDVIKNMSLVLVNNQQEAEQQHLQTFETAYRHSLKDTMICALKLRYTIVPFNVGYFILFVYVCYKRVQQHTMQPSTFVALIIILFKIYNSIWDISGVMNDTILRWGLLKHTIEVFNHLPSPKNEPNDSATLNTHVSTSGFVFKDVSFVYKNKQANTTILEHFNLHIEKGKTVVIIGGIGSGKSTILKLILKQLTPKDGKIYYQGMPYSKLRTPDIRRLIGFIQQQPVLLNRSIYDNIRYGLSDIRKEDVQDLIKKLGLNDMFARFPKGIDTNVGKYGSNLSGGQKQVILILRIMLIDPPVLLMDEPTAAIDENTKKTIYGLLSKLMRDKTVVMVTHDDFLHKYADRIIELKNGQLVKDTLVKRT